MTTSGFKEHSGADCVTIRETTYIMCVLDAVGWAFGAIEYFASGSDSATQDFDHAAGVIVTALFVITAFAVLLLTAMIAFS